MEQYVQSRVDHRLQAAFRRVSQTQSGRPGAEASRQKRVRYVISRVPGGLTLNIIRHVFIDRLCLESADEADMAGTIAHEGSHVAQSFLSSSLRQEAQAFITAARVLVEFGYEDSDGWTTCSLEAATKKVLELYPDHPLYVRLPVEQREGWRDFVEMIRQGLILFKAAFDILLQ